MIKWLTVPLKNKAYILTKNGVPVRVLNATQLDPTMLCKAVLETTGYFVSLKQEQYHPENYSVLTATRWSHGLE